MTLRLALILLPFVALSWALILATGAVAHNFYEWRCCSDRDCKPVPDDAVTEGPNGYVINRTGEVIPYRDTRIRQSPDHQFHRCTVAGREDGRTLCVYVPGRSF